MTELERQLISALDLMIRESIENFKLRRSNSLSYINSHGLGFDLAKLIEEYTESNRIQRAGYFIEGLASNKQIDSREIYLSERKKSGRSRAHATNQWKSFNARLGLGDDKRFRMNEGQFFIHERALLAEIGISRPVIDVVIESIKLYNFDIDSIILKLHEFRKDQLQNSIRSLLHSSSSPGSLAFSVQRASGLITVIADCMVLFFTRDWGVAGTLSTMAGSSILAISD